MVDANAPRFWLERNDNIEKEWKQRLVLVCGCSEERRIDVVFVCVLVSGLKTKVCVVSGVARFCVKLVFFST